MALSKKDENTIYLLAEKITGTSQAGNFRKEVLVRNVERRMGETKSQTLNDYLLLVNRDPQQYQKLISDLTIHTTSWFREEPHYELLKQQALEKFRSGKKIFSFWSSACSTGEEVYSAALVLEGLRSELDGFDYQIYGSDIDFVSIEKAQKAIYDSSGLEQIPQAFKKFMLLGQGNAAGLMTLDPDIRKRIHFFQNNLAVAPYKMPIEAFDAIFCRNVLIYFDKKLQEAIVQELVGKLNDGGLVVLGHSDSFPTNGDIHAVGRSSYKKERTKKMVKPVVNRRKKILIIDDSATIRKVIGKILTVDFDVDECDSAAAADEILKTKKYDLITLDLNMPNENGSSWLVRNRKAGLATPVVIVSDSSPMEAEKVFGALAEGAQDYIVKSRLQSEPEKIVELLKSLTETQVDNLLQSYDFRPFTNKNLSPKVVLIGASTGGPEALAKLLKEFPRPTPPMVVVQHISPEFSKAFATRLAQVSGLNFKEIDEHRALQINSLYIATGDYHLTLSENDGDLFIKKSEEPKTNGHRPSVDILFNSASKVRVDSVSVLLTGMGKDGAMGLLNLAETNRSYTLAQDEKSSVVFGMPKKAIELGASCFIGDLSAIRAEMLKAIKGFS